MRLSFYVASLIYAACHMYFCKRLIWQRRMSRPGLILSGAVAFVLVASGIDGVTSYVAGQHWRALGIYPALGATPENHPGSSCETCSAYRREEPCHWCGS